MVALGLMVTVTLNCDPTPQVAVVGVTRYVAVTALLVVLVSVPVILITPEDCVIPPVNPIPVGADHV